MNAMLGKSFYNVAIYQTITLYILNILHFFVNYTSVKWGKSCSLEFSRLQLTICYFYFYYFIFYF